MLPECDVILVGAPLLRSCTASSVLLVCAHLGRWCTWQRNSTPLPGSRNQLEINWSHSRWWHFLERIPRRQHQTLTKESTSKDSSSYRKRHRVDDATIIHAHHHPTKILQSLGFLRKLNRLKPLILFPPFHPLSTSSTASTRRK